MPVPIYSKKDLEKLYHLADTTVYRTLKACRLPTSRRYYTQEEIDTRFEPARLFFKLGYTTKQIQERFDQKEISEVTVDGYKEGTTGTL